MFEPTIKYRRVNDPSPKDITKSLDNLSITNVNKQDPIVITTTTEEDSTDVVSKEQKVVELTKEETNNNKINEPEPEPEKTSSFSPTNTVKTEADYTFEEEEEEEYKIQVDPEDKERIIVTLSTGKQFAADRYCPHGGADLSFHGKVSETDYPPEIGPVLMCPIHYWEFALEKGGKGGSGWATINACPIEMAEKCVIENKKLDW